MPSAALYRALNEGFSQHRNKPPAQVTSSPSKGPDPRNAKRMEYARNLLSNKRDTVDALRRDDVAKLFMRRWRAGDVYTPRDLKFTQQQKFKPNMKRAPTYDVFDLLGIDPLKEYKVCPAITV